RLPLLARWPQLRRDHRPRRTARPSSADPPLRRGLLAPRGLGRGRARNSVDGRGPDPRVVRSPTMGWMERVRLRRRSETQGPSAKSSAVETDTDQSSSHELARARDLIAQSEFVDAEAIARREIKLDPWSVAARVLLVHALIGQDRVADARAEARRSIDIAPEDPRG